MEGEERAVGEVRVRADTEAEAQALALPIVLESGKDVVVGLRVGERVGVWVADSEGVSTAEGEGKPEAVVCSETVSDTVLVGLAEMQGEAVGSVVAVLPREGERPAVAERWEGEALAEALMLVEGEGEAGTVADGADGDGGSVSELRALGERDPEAPDDGDTDPLHIVLGDSEALGLEDSEVDLEATPDAVIAREGVGGSEGDALEQKLLEPVPSKVGEGLCDAHMEGEPEGLEKCESEGRCEELTEVLPLGLGCGVGVTGGVAVGSMESACVVV